MRGIRLGCACCGCACGCSGSGACCAACRGCTRFCCCCEWDSDLRGSADGGGAARAACPFCIGVHGYWCNCHRGDVTTRCSWIRVCTIARVISDFGVGVWGCAGSSSSAGADTWPGAPGGNAPFRAPARSIAAWRTGAVICACFCARLATTVCCRGEHATHAITYRCGASDASCTFCARGGAFQKAQWYNSGGAYGWWWWRRRRRACARCERDERAEEALRHGHSAQVHVFPQGRVHAGRRMPISARTNNGAG